MPVIYRVDVPGGSVKVELTEEQAYLTGPAVLVAHGELAVPERHSSRPKTRPAASGASQPARRSINVCSGRILAVRQGLGGHGSQSGHRPGPGHSPGGSRERRRAAGPRHRRSGRGHRGLEALGVTAMQSPQT